MRRNGQVLWYNIAKGYGEVKCTSSEKFFFTSREVKGSLNFEKFSRGQRVSFIISSEFVFGIRKVSKIVLDEIASRSLESTDETTM